MFFYLILKKRVKISDTAAGLPWGRLRRDSLSAFGASLRPTLLAMTSRCPKIGFGPEKLINSTFLLLLKVIIHQNWSVIETQKVIFCFQINRENQNQKTVYFSEKKSLWFLNSLNKNTLKKFKIKFGAVYQTRESQILLLWSRYLN